MTPDFLQDPTLNKDKTALILIQGSGAVRSGVWARSVCINSNFETGSMLPQVAWAQSNGYGCIILNPNNNTDTSDQPIPDHSTASDHTESVWLSHIVPAGFTNLLVIAHSAAGGCIARLAKN